MQPSQATKCSIPEAHRLSNEGTLVLNKATGAHEFRATYAVWWRPERLPEADQYALVSTA